MEERLSEPLPLLPLDNDQTSLRSVTSTTGPFTTPGSQRNTQDIIHWQATTLLNRIDTNVLVDFVPKLAGAFCEIDKVPIITSYVNMLLLLHEKDTNMQWITRFPYRQEDPKFLPGQVEPVIRARRKFSFKMPHLYHYGLAKDPRNPLGLDFMLLQFIDGRMMTMWNETYPLLVQKKQVLDQMADIYLEIFSKPVTYEDRLVLRHANRDPIEMQKDFDAFDLPPSNSTSAYLHCFTDDAIRGKIERLVADDAQEQADILGTTMDHRYADLLTLLMMRALIPTQVIAIYNDAPFYISHPDLHNRNIIIDGKPLHEPSAMSRRERSFSEGGYHMNPPGGQRHRPRTVSVGGADGSKPDELKCAAIYPKFLETLPGAEFPDLPENYVKPDLNHEKETFLEMFNKKEYERTGKTIVSDLIGNGSWERDFFHVALGRGDVRLQWFRWWKREEVEKGTKHKWLWDEFLQNDVDNIRAGLQGFLGSQKNRDTVDACHGWALISRVLVDLEHFEALAAESSWTTPFQKEWVQATPARLQRCATGTDVPTRITSRVRAMDGKSPSTQQGDGLLEPVAGATGPPVLDNAMRFILGDGQGRIVKMEGKVCRSLEL